MKTSIKLLSIIGCFAITFSCFANNNLPNEGSKSIDLVIKINEIDIQYGEFSGENMKFQTRIDGVRQIYFQDPDGYWIEINDVKH